MEILQISEIIRLIKEAKTFEATASDGSFSIKVNRYVPYCCTAIHDGNRLRPELKEKIALEEYERWYEEDPWTGDFIGSMPITMIGHDSRFEYDLNRRPEECIYEEAWGKKVWKKKLTPKDRQTSLAKHSNFYNVLQALVKKLEELYNGCIVYDMHSYNYQRWDKEVPLFNIGTERLDHKRFSAFIEHWRDELAAIHIDGVENVSAINEVFYGRGYNLEFVTSNFDNTLVLATEVKKVYCNELTGEDFPSIIRDLQQQLKKAILNNAGYFAKENTSWSSKKNVHLLDKKHDPAIKKVDHDLYRLLRGFELLAYVNPTNSATEQRKFVKQKFTELPKFKYAPIKVNPFELKQKLGALRTQDISDVSVRDLYESVINSYFDKIDLLGSLNSKTFLYNSLRYFGRPSKKDILNAQYILHLPPIPTEPRKVPHITTEMVIPKFKEALAEYGISCKIETSKRVISQVMVLNSKKTILFRKDAKFMEKEVKALIEHEIGVHMVTTQNAEDQALKIFHVGLPVNTKTQEGLAILSEFLSGNITLLRLKKLALRVIVADMMCNGANFIECFKFLVQQHGVGTSDAYTIVTRIFRGGGFTKDYLYLSGFVRILKMWNQGMDLSPLLVGKTSLEFYDTITEMIDRGMVEKPKFITHSFVNPNMAGNSNIYDYIISGLK